MKFTFVFVFAGICFAGALSQDVDLEEAVMDYQPSKEFDDVQVNEDDVPVEEESIEEIETSKSQN